MADFSQLTTRGYQAPAVLFEPPGDDYAERRRDHASEFLDVLATHAIDGESLTLYQMGWTDPQTEFADQALSPMGGNAIDIQRFRKGGRPEHDLVADRWRRALAEGRVSSNWEPQEVHRWGIRSLRKPAPIYVQRCSDMIRQAEGAGHSVQYSMDLQGQPSRLTGILGLSASQTTDFESVGENIDVLAQQTSLHPSLITVTGSGVHFLFLFDRPFELEQSSPGWIEKLEVALGKLTGVRAPAPAGWPHSRLYTSRYLPGALQPNGTFTLMFRRDEIEYHDPSYIGHRLHEPFDAYHTKLAFSGVGSAIHSNPVFRQDSESNQWVLSWSGSRSIVRHTKGMIAIRALLRKPGHRISCLDLMSEIDPSGPGDTHTRAPKGTSARHASSVVRTRNRSGQTRRVDRGELRSEWVEKTRKSIGRLIQTALKNIKNQNVDLANHLLTSIKDPSGATPGYLPESSTVWDT